MNNTPFSIQNKQILSPRVKRLDIRAESVARSVRPGQFVMVAPDENSPWLPLTVIESDPRKGTVAVIVHDSDERTSSLENKPIRDPVFAVIGPCGQAFSQTDARAAVCLASGTGIADILPVCRILKKNGGRVIGVIGASSKKDLMLETQMRLACTKFYQTSEDNLRPERRRPSDVLPEILKNQDDVDLVYAAGPLSFMKEIAEITRPRRIRTLARLSGDFRCGLGLCGACRLPSAESFFLPCVEGPEADAHQLDFDLLQKRFSALEAQKQIVLTFDTAGPGKTGLFARIMTGLFREEKS